MAPEKWPGMAARGELSKIGELATMADGETLTVERSIF
jgi:hypothetical protein